MVDHNKAYEEWKKAVAYVKENEQTLRTAYGGDCIAVKDNCVVSHGKDKLELAKEIKGKFPNSFVLIQTIEDIINPELYVDRPEIEVRALE